MRVGRTARQTRPENTSGWQQNTSAVSRSHRPGRKFSESTRASGTRSKPTDCWARMTPPIQALDNSTSQTRKNGISVSIHRRPLWSFQSKSPPDRTGNERKTGWRSKSSLLVEAAGNSSPFPTSLLNRITVCQPREMVVAPRPSPSQSQPQAGFGWAGHQWRTRLGEVRSRRWRVELADGRVLDQGFREFLPGYAVTSYGSQGKTVDYVLFSDSTIKAATNAQQW